MAKAIHLAGGNKGKKNTIARSHANQKSKDGSKAKVGVTPAVRVYKKASDNPKPGASSIKAVTRPNMPNPGKGAIGHARQWFKKHGMTAPTLHPFDRTSHPADMVGTTKSVKSSKKTTPVSSGAHGKVTYQARAAKSSKKPTVLGS